MITLMYSNYAPSTGHVARLEALVGTGKVHVAVDEASSLAHAGDTRIVLGHRYLRQILPHAPELRWVQTTAAGHDHLPWQVLASRGILFSRNPLGARAIAHHVVALSWSLLRRLPQAFQAQAKGIWAQPFSMLPLPSTAMILGMGNIGLTTAALFRSLGLKVIGVGTLGNATQKQGCDEFLFPDEWASRLPDVDILVMCLPLDQRTRDCIDVEELALLPQHAVVVNVGRSGTLNHAALGQALERGRLGGGALDVLDPVPMPDDWLWRLPNLIITPIPALCQRAKSLRGFTPLNILFSVSG